MEPTVNIEGEKKESEKKDMHSYSSIGGVVRCWLCWSWGRGSTCEEWGWAPAATCHVGAVGDCLYEVIHTVHHIDLPVPFAGGFLWTYYVHKYLLICSDNPGLESQRLGGTRRADHISPGEANKRLLGEGLHFKCHNCLISTNGINFNSI